jgi:hypothetical protein
MFDDGTAPHCSWEEGRESLLIFAYARRAGIDQAECTLCKRFGSGFIGYSRGCDGDRGGGFHLLELFLG